MALKRVNPLIFAARIRSVSVGRVFVRVLMCSVALSAFSIFLSTEGYAQQATSSEPFRLRGTTGSGEQDPVFSESIEDANNSDVNADPIRNTADPVQQLQGRALPAQRALPVVDPAVTGTPSAKSNVRASVEQSGTGALPETDPFTATGFRIGSWRAFTSLEQVLGYSSNINGVAMGEGGAFSETQIDLSLQSDWSRHSARIDANGTFRKPFTSVAEELPSANVSAGLTLDLVDGVSADFGANYGFTTESTTSSTITSSASNRPGVHAFGSSAGISRTGGRLDYSLRGSVGRTVYEDISLTSGGTESQKDRNNTLYSAIGRVGYEISPALTPFVELEAGIRDYDEKTDRNGDNRNSVIMGARAGVAVDLGEKLNGEISAGYRIEDYEGENLKNLESVTLDGNVVWSPERDTTIEFAAQTGFSGSTTSGQNGSVVFGADVTGTRQINDRLSLTANGGVDITRQDDGSRTDTVWTASTGFNYWVNRFMAFTGSVEHTVQQSTGGAINEFDDTTIQTGVRFQR
jgi:hypothetical protein